MASGATSFLDPVLNPLLALHPFWAIFVITAVITLIITVVYKYTTDQKKMRKLRDDLKTIQKKSQELAKTNPQKALDMQKEAMSKNAELMKHSLKPTLYTFIPIIIIFGWLNAHMAYYSLQPDVPFNVTLEFAQGTTGAVAIDVLPALDILSPKTQEIQDGKVHWTLKGAEGEYLAGFKYNEETFEKQIRISTARFYEPPEKLIKSSSLQKIVVGNKPIRPFGDNFKLIWWTPGWLGTYFVLAIILSTLFKKILNVV